MSFIIISISNIKKKQNQIILQRFFLLEGFKSKIFFLKSVKIKVVLKYLHNHVVANSLVTPWPFQKVVDLRLKPPIFHVTPGTLVIEGFSQQRHPWLFQAALTPPLS